MADVASILRELAYGGPKANAVEAQQKLEAMPSVWDMVSGARQWSKQDPYLQSVRPQRPTYGADLFPMPGQAEQSELGMTMLPEAAQKENLASSALQQFFPQDGKTKPWEEIGKGSAGLAPGSSIANLYSQIGSKVRESITRQQQGVEDMKKRLEEYTAAPSEVDLSGLMMIADQWNEGKTNLAGAYQKVKPESASEKKLKVQALRSVIQNAEGKITDAEINLLKTKLMGELQQQKLAAGKLGRPLDRTATDKITDYDKGFRNVNQLEDLLKANQDIIGPLAGMKSWNPYSTESRKILAILKQVKQVVGKTLEGGVLRKEDEAKYEKILPTLFDQPAVAFEKIKNLRKDIRLGRQEYLDNLKRAGFDTSGFVGTSPQQAEEKEKSIWKKAYRWM